MRYRLSRLLLPVQWCRRRSAPSPEVRQTTEPSGLRSSRPFWSFPKLLLLSVGPTVRIALVQPLTRPPHCRPVPPRRYLASGPPPGSLWYTANAASSLPAGSPTPLLSVGYQG